MAESTIARVQRITQEVVSDNPYIEGITFNSRTRTIQIVFSLAESVHIYNLNRDYLAEPDSVISDAIGAHLLKHRIMDKPDGRGTRSKAPTELFWVEMRLSGKAHGYARDGVRGGKRSTLSACEDSRQMILAYDPDATVTIYRAETRWERVE